LTQPLNSDIKRIPFFQGIIMTSENLTPTEFSDKQAASFISRSLVKARKERGQFFTPLPVARFMAGLAEYRKEVFSGS